MQQQHTALDSVLKGMIRSKQSALYKISRITAMAYLINTAVQSALSMENYKGHFSLISSRDCGWL